jgi:preprotein translocase subunit YajC
MVGFEARSSGTGYRFPSLGNTVDKQLPLIILALVFLGVLMLSRRNRRRAAAADAARRERIMPGAEVMTTSGLYGTVVANNGDGTVLLSIAPGVEVKWSLAALREPAELPETYRGAIGRQPAQAQPDISDDAEPK